MTLKSLIANNLVEFSKKSKILEKEEEFYHIENWKKNRQSKSLQIILNAYLRLAVSYARKYKNYGLPMDDLIHEGVLGIMHALEKFEISKFLILVFSSFFLWLFSVRRCEYTSKSRYLCPPLNHSHG